VLASMNQTRTRGCSSALRSRRCCRRLRQSLAQTHHA